jgi:adenylate kinase
VGGVSSFPKGNESHTPTRQPNSHSTEATNKHTRKKHKDKKKKPCTLSQFKPNLAETRLFKPFPTFTRRKKKTRCNPKNQNPTKSKPLTKRGRGVDFRATESNPKTQNQKEASHSKPHAKNTKNDGKAPNCVSNLPRKQATSQPITTTSNQYPPMPKRVILITGTPAVGKTTLAKKLTETLNAQYINLTELAETEHLTTGKDKERETTIINENKMRQKLKELIQKAQSDLIIDGHYAAAVTPKTLTTHIFVLRRNPIQLREFMQKSGFNKPKQTENLTAEILDVCLVEALREQPKEKICELDITDKTVDETLSEVLAVLEDKKKCHIGCVDWLGMLEAEGKLDEYLET